MFDIASINLNILECKCVNISGIDNKRLGINLNILECK